MKLRALFLAIILSLVLALPLNAASTVEVDGTASISAGANTIALGFTASHIIIKLSSGSSSVYVTVNGGAVASSSNFLIDSGGTLAIGMAGSCPSNQINYYGNGTTGTISWMTW